MFQETVMHRMENELDRLKKKLEEQENFLIRNYKKIIIVTFASGLFYSMQSKFFARLLYLI